jgi:hypothetical protein
MTSRAGCNRGNEKKTCNAKRNPYSSRMTTSEQYDLHPIECAVIDLEDRSGSKWEAWSAAEMKHLKKVCFAKDAPAIGPDLYRAVVAENNGWSYKAGAADCNTVEMFAREWETYKNENQ